MNKTIILRTFLVILILIRCLLPSAEASLSDRVFEATLANGMKVIILEDHSAPTTTFQLWYRVGSQDEAWGKTGLSHMMEHMMYKGTGEIGPEEYSRIIQKNGGDDNAFTTQDYTSFFVNISADRLRIPIDLESDRMRNLTLREEDFKVERNVILEERRLSTEDDPQEYLYEQLQAIAFLTSSYRWPIIGWQHDIEQLTLDDVKMHHRLYYHPGNAFLILAGDLEKDELLKEIEKGFGTIPKGENPLPGKNREIPQNGERRIIVKREASLPWLLIGYHVPNYPDQDSVVLEVIATLLSHGKSSRFYRSLVLEKKLALDVEADHSLLSRDPHLFFISATATPGSDVRTLEQAIHGEIALLQSETMGDRELEKAKNQIAADFLFAQDSIFGQAMLLGQFEIVTGWREIDAYLPSVQKVTPEDIRRVAKKYLTEVNRTVGILLPLPKQENDND